jgi:glycosyltransferase involved in cell wall biosynthesis
MRILMLSELYPPYIGGTEEHVRNLSRGLVQRGHDVAVATIGPAERPTLEDDYGVRVYRLRSTLQRAPSLMPSGRPYAPPFPDPVLVRALRRVIRHEQPAVVHAHNWIVHSFVPLKRRGGAKLVVTLHDYGVVCAKRTLMYDDRQCTGPGIAKCLRCAAAHYGPARGPAITVANWVMSRPLSAAVDMFVPVSQAVATGNALAQRRAPFTVVPNFVPDDVARLTDDSHPGVAQLPDGPFWLYVGTLSRHKGIHVLLEAYRQVDGAPPLVLIGRRTVDVPGDVPPKVIVLGDLPHEAVMSAWRRSAVGFVPSLLPEACPTVAIEAMACGVPVVASRIGGLPELVVDGQTGLLVEPGDVRGLSVAMLRLLERSAERAEMSKAATRRAPEFMAARVIDRLEAVYAEVLG